MKLQSFKSTLQTTVSLASQRISPRRLAQRYRNDDRGVAAIEFAFIAPVMIGMYFGLAELAHAISVDRQISHGTNVVGDLSTQMPELKDEEIEEVLAAAIRVMNVKDVSKLSIDMESFILPAEGQPPQSRGRIQLNSSVGNFAPFNAASLDDRILNHKSGVVVTRVRYKYTPIKVNFLDPTVTLEETFMLKPRRSDAVDFQDGNGSLIGCGATSYANVSCSTN